MRNSAGWQPLVDAGLVGDDADLFIDGFVDVLYAGAQNEGLPGGCLQLAGEDLDGSGFARAAGAQEAQNLAPVQDGAEVFEYLRPAEALGDMLQPDAVVGHAVHSFLAR